ncbi:hypothetical protein [Streptomyces sp. NPDC001652]|uniref:hypothetical protein n=1 Tax=Streptomyces sp. NPDC001652 TaxID=3154393 RepID=UPI00332C8F34
MTQQPLTDQQLDDIAASVAATFDQFEPAETRQARWEAAALAAGREVDRNALRVYMAVADAEQLALAKDWARPVASTDAEIRRLRVNPPMVCINCETPVGWVDCPTGGWWAHETHPADGHDADPRPAAVETDGTPA